jgi:uncharacterized protein
LHIFSIVIARIIQPRLTKAWQQFPIVVLTGARQVGKTTLARQLLPQANYVTLDIPAEAERARLTPSDFLASYANGQALILDEVQYVPQLFRHLKILVDANRQPGQFFLTGSQSFELMAGVSESLAGRCAIMTLPTLSLTELPDVNSDEFLWRGGYPELWQRPDLERELWLGSYLATYLERDVRNILNIGNLRDFDRFLRAAALRAGQILSYSELARDVGIAPNTAKNWISVLEASQQIFLLEPYHRQRTKRLVKSPKLYFSDTGLLTFLMGFTHQEELFKHGLWGAIWENFVVAEIRKKFLTQGRRPPLWFWRTSAGEEVDLLIETAPEQFTVVECKTAAQVNPTALKSLHPLRSEYGEQSVTQAYVACRTNRSYPLNESNTMTAIPLNGKDGLLAKI